MSSVLTFLIESYIIHYGTCLLFSNTKSPISVLFDKYYVIVLHELWNVICRSNYGMFTGLYHNNLVHVQNIVLPGLLFGLTQVTFL